MQASNAGNALTKLLQSPPPVVDDENRQAQWSKLCRVMHTLLIKQHQQYLKTVQEKDGEINRLETVMNGLESADASSIIRGVYMYVCMFC
jgi:hypothetical protein